MDTPPKLPPESCSCSSWLRRYGTCGTIIVLLLLLVAPRLNPESQLQVIRVTSQQQGVAASDLLVEDAWHSLRRQGTMNVLYVVLEDFGVLGSALFAAPGGAANGTTPNLERLAKRGVVFRKAYCQAPICNPSRTSILVGRRPSYTRVYTNDDRYDVHVPPHTPQLADFLRASDSRASVACGGGKLFHEACDTMARGFALPELRSAAAPLASALPASSAASAPTNGGLSNDQVKVNDTIDLLGRYAANGSRFFLGLGLSATHVMRPAGLCSLRAARAAALDDSPRTLESIPLPPRRSGERRPPLVTWPNYDLKASASMTARKRGMSPTETRLAIASYFACAAHVDSQLGRLLDALDGLHLASTTAVVVHSDHGFSLGRHGRWSKYSLYEEVTRVPLMIAVPGIRSAVAVDDIVETVDILPTLLDLWGVPRGGAVTDGSEEPFVSSYSLHGRSVRLDGHSLLPFLDAAVSRTFGEQPASHAHAAAAPANAAMPVLEVGAAWSKWYARSELHETFRRNVFDGPVTAGGQADAQWPGVQLWVRTARYAYTAFFEVLDANRTSAAPPANERDTARHAGFLRLVDETLYDTGGNDPEEADNLAYDAVHQAKRTRLLELCLKDWSVRLRGPRDATRGQRIAYFKDPINR